MARTTRSASIVAQLTNLIAQPCAEPAGWRPHPSVGPRHKSLQLQPESHRRRALLRAGALEYYPCRATLGWTGEAPVLARLLLRASRKKMRADKKEAALWRFVARVRERANRAAQILRLAQETRSLRMTISTCLPCRRRGRRPRPELSSLPESRRPGLRW
jgi:hypothetical protein